MLELSEVYSFFKPSQLIPEYSNLLRLAHNSSLFPYSPVKQPLQRIVGRARSNHIILCKEFLEGPQTDLDIVSQLFLFSPLTKKETPLYTLSRTTGPNASKILRVISATVTESRELLLFSCILRSPNAKVLARAKPSKVFVFSVCLKRAAPAPELVEAFPPGESVQLHFLPDDVEAALTEDAKTHPYRCLVAAVGGTNLLQEFRFLLGAASERREFRRRKKAAARTEVKQSKVFLYSKAFVWADFLADANLLATIQRPAKAKGDAQKGRAPRAAPRKYKVALYTLKSAAILPKHRAFDLSVLTTATFPAPVLPSPDCERPTSSLFGRARLFLTSHMLPYVAACFPVSSAQREDFEDVESETSSTLTFETLGGLRPPPSTFASPETQDLSPTSPPTPQGEGDAGHVQVTIVPIGCAQQFSLIFERIAAAAAAPHGRGARSLPFDVTKIDAFQSMTKEFLPLPEEDKVRRNRISKMLWGWSEPVLLPLEGGLALFAPRFPKGARTCADAQPLVDLRVIEISHLRAPRLVYASTAHGLSYNPRDTKRALYACQGAKTAKALSTSSVSSEGVFHPLQQASQKRGSDRPLPVLPIVLGHPNLRSKLIRGDFKSLRREIDRAARVSEPGLFDTLPWPFLQCLGGVRSVTDLEAETARAPTDTAKGFFDFRRAPGAACKQPPRNVDTNGTPFYVIEAGAAFYPREVAQPGCEQSMSVPSSSPLDSELEVAVPKPLDMSGASLSVVLQPPSAEPLALPQGFGSDEAISLGITSPPPSDTFVSTPQMYEWLFEKTSELAARAHTLGMTSSLWNTEFDLNELFGQNLSQPRFVPIFFAPEFGPHEEAEGTACERERVAKRRVGKRFHGLKPRAPVAEKRRPPKGLFASFIYDWQNSRLLRFRSSFDDLFRELLSPVASGKVLSAREQSLRTSCGFQCAAILLSGVGIADGCADSARIEEARDLVEKLMHTASKLNVVTQEVCSDFLFTYAFLMLAGREKTTFKETLSFLYALDTYSDIRLGRHLKMSFSTASAADPSGRTAVRYNKQSNIIFESALGPLQQKFFQLYYLASSRGSPAWARKLAAQAEREGYKRQIQRQIHQRMFSETSQNSGPSNRSTSDPGGAAPDAAEPEERSSKFAIFFPKKARGPRAAAASDSADADADGSHFAIPARFTKIFRFSSHKLIAMMIAYCSDTRVAPLPAFKAPQRVRGDPRILAQLVCVLETLERYRCPPVVELFDEISFAAFSTAPRSTFDQLLAVGAVSGIHPLSMILKGDAAAPAAEAAAEAVPAAATLDARRPFGRYHRFAAATAAFDQEMSRTDYVDMVLPVLPNELHTRQAFATLRLTHQPLPLKTDVTMCWIQTRWNHLFGESPRDAGAAPPDAAEPAPSPLRLSCIPLELYYALNLSRRRVAEITDDFRDGMCTAAHVFSVCTERPLRLQDPLHFLELMFVRECARRARALA